jgi:nicotinamidase-related amidase
MTGGCGSGRVWSEPEQLRWSTAMSWKTAHRSFYYEGAPEPDDPVLAPAETALLCIDVQNYGLVPKETPDEQARWQPFFDRMRETVIPRLRALQEDFRVRGMDVIHARIACLLGDGRDRSLSQKMPGWNNLLMPKHTEASQIVPELAPRPGEIVVTKTTDSALTGTNLRLVLANMGIRNLVVTGIYTDQCVSSTVRSLADESFNVVVVEDCCAAGTDDLHRRELEIINMIYCHVMSSRELLQLMP